MSAHAGEYRSESRIMPYLVAWAACSTVLYVVIDALDQELLMDEGGEPISNEANLLLKLLPNFDPEDPNQFRKLVKMALAAGVSALALAARYGMNQGTAERWADGTSVPAKEVRRSIFNEIRNMLRGQ
jgi:hypothetical protein